MTEPQGGGGTPVTTYEAILLCLLGYEVMAAGYGDDEDWCGVYISDVDTCIGRRPSSFGLGAEAISFDIDGFAAWGPFATWEARTIEKLEEIRGNV